MEIQQEQTNKHTIQAYSNTGIRVNGTNHETNLILSANQIKADWEINEVVQLTDHALEPILKQEPEIIIIGHTKPAQFVPVSTLQKLSKQRIGLECMSIGAACRTYNILLSEGRRVVLGLLLNKP